jgi:uncharacterized membrane-anchored protein
MPKLTISCALAASLLAYASIAQAKPRPDPKAQAGPEAQGGETDEDDPGDDEAPPPPGGEAAQAGPKIDWKIGPAKGALGSMAEIAIPAGFRFTGAEDTRRIMEVMQNPVSGKELGFLAPDEGKWFLVFEFDDIGYVKDDEKDKLDAEAILKSIKEGNEHGNEERKERGWATLQIVGWEQPPAYDPETHNLEWAVRASSEGKPVINYNTRILGRGGVMEVSLVVEPDVLKATLPSYKTLLKGYGFTPGQTYAEYKKGDKLAEYGLTALVTGGAVAVSAKTGILAKLGKGLWKIIVLIAASVSAFFKKIFGKKEAPDTGFAKVEADPPPPEQPPAAT